MARCRHRRALLCAAGALSPAVLFACAAPPPAAPPNPFVGTWANADNDTVAIEQTTIVEHQPGGQPVALDSAACRGVFSFTYATSSTRSLTALLPRQPNLASDLAGLLVAPSYPVAVLHCGQGDHTYVLVNDHELVAIYRDGDIGAVERLARR